MPYKKNTSKPTPHGDKTIRNRASSKTSGTPAVRQVNQAPNQTGGKKGIPGGVKSANTGSTSQSAGGGLNSRTQKGRHKGPAVSKNSC